MRTGSSPKWGWTRWALGILLAAAYLACGILLDVAPSHDAVVRDGICRQLLAGETAGRQGAVSSLCWGPLSTLAALPFVFVAGGWAVPLGPLVVSALFGAATVLLLEQALRRWGAGRWRLVLAGGLAVNPMFVAECWNGSSSTVVAAFSVLAAYSLASWLSARRIPDLVWFALSTAMLTAAGIEVLPWVLVSWCFLATAETLRRADAAESKATAIIAFLPGLYAMAIWVLMNWLIMGDPFYFARGLIGSGRPHGGGFIFSDRSMAAAACLTALVAAVLARAVKRRDRAEAAVATMGLALVAGSGLLGMAGLMWESSPLIGAGVPLAFLIAGYWGSTGDLRRPVKWLAAALLVLAATLIPAGWKGPDTGGMGGVPWVRSHGDQTFAPWLPQLEHHVRSRSEAAKVFVCGYDSFAMLRTNPGDVFVRALDFNFDKARRDYYGQTLYILIHRPAGKAALDSIHRKYRNIYIQGGRDTLYDSDWGEWRLFEIVQGSLNRKG